MEKTQVILGLFLMFTAAKIAGELFMRLKQPPVIGELLAGALIGAHALGLIQPSEVYEVIAELGVIILLFSVGLETKMDELAEVGLPAVLVGLFGVLVPLGLGFLGVKGLGFSNITALFIGTAMIATSVGITARVLADMGLIQHRVSRIILGAAILDDILGLMVLAVVTSLAKQSFDVVQFSVLAFEAVFFVAFLTFFGTRLAERHGSLLKVLRISEAPYAFSIVLFLGLSVLAEYIGLAAIIGAFLAGLVLAETEEEFALHQKVRPLYSFMVPFFFVMMGTQVDFGAFLNLDILKLILIVVALAVIGKIVGAAMGTFFLGLRSMLQAGVGMVPRGEVGMVVALIGLNLGVITSDIYTAVVAMSLLTTIIAPPLIKIAFKGEKTEEKPPPSKVYPQLWGEKS